MASGDEELLDYGLWLRGNLGNGTFKTKEFNRVKQKSSGGTIGFDGKIDEDTVLGIAVHYNKSNLKPKLIASNNGNNHYPFSTDISSIIGSLYGSMQVNEQLILTGNIEFGKLYGKTKHQKFLTANERLKLKGDLLGANIGAHYYQPLGFLTLVPSISGSIEVLKLGAIKHGNLDISKTAIQKFSIIPGLVLMGIAEFDNWQLISQVSASYSNAALFKSKKLKIKNSRGQILADSKIKASKHSYNLGASLALVSSRIEASLGYERIWQSKYLGHEGYLKLRLNI